MALAGPARGDPDTDLGAGNDDAAFLASLRAAGVTYTQADQAVIIGHAVCKLVDSGKSGPEVLGLLQTRNPELTTQHGLKFMAVAVQSYCPQLSVPSVDGTG